MGISTRIINQDTYQFVQSIATRFDGLTFPGTPSKSIVEPLPQRQPFNQEVREQTWNEKGKKWDVVSSVKERVNERAVRRGLTQKIAPDTRALIASNAVNFSHWVLITGMTDPSIQKIHRSTVLDLCAKPLLDKFKIKKNSQSHRDQLLTHVFEIVFTQSSEEERAQLITDMNRCRATLGTFSFKLKMVIFKIQVQVARFFSNGFVQLCIGLIAAWQSVKLYWLARALFDQHVKGYYIPKAVNSFINHAPIQAVKVVSGGIATIQYLIDHQIRLTLICWLMVGIAGPYRPYARKVGAVVLFPSKLVSRLSVSSLRIFIDAFNTSQRVQNTLTRYTAESGANAQRQMINEKAPQAYQLWMHLMKKPEELYLQEQRGLNGLKSVGVA